VTDGETNATIPRGETVEEVDFERAKQLLADKRAKGPVKKRTTTRSTAKSSTAKASTAKTSTAKKAPAAKKTTTAKSSAAKKK
jgi:DNA topoisomerase-1